MLLSCFLSSSLFSGFPVNLAGVGAANNWGHGVPGRLGRGAGGRATGSMLRQVHGGCVHVTAGEGFAIMRAAVFSSTAVMIPL